MADRDWDAHHAAHAHGHGHGGDDPSAHELSGFLAALPALPRRALDIGCGTGADAVLLAGFGIDTTGLDSSPTALDQARARAAAAGTRVTWLEADARAMPLDEASIDLALDRGFLHHLAANEQPRYALEVARVLRPGGLFLIRELNHPGHGQLAVSEQSIRTMVEGTPLRLRSSLTHAGRVRQTLFVVLERDGD